MSYSFNYFCHNINLVSECTNMVPADPDATLTLFWSCPNPLTNSNYVALTTNQAAFMNWMIVKDDIVFVNNIVDMTYDRSDLWRTTDFGASWTLVGQPYDSVWNAYDPANYATISSRSRVHRMFFMNGSTIGVAAGYTPGSGGQNYSCFTTNDLGDTWSLANCGVSTNVDSSTDPAGSYTKAASYGFTCGHNADRSRIIFGARPRGALAGYMILPPGHTSIPASTSPNNELVNVATSSLAGSPDTNTYFITQLSSGWVYQTRNNTNIWATDHAAAQGYRRVSQIYWDPSNNPSPTWRANYVGSWRSVNQYSNWSTNGWYIGNGTVGFDNYAWMTNGRDLLIPSNGYNTSANANFAVYSSMKGLVPEVQDYSGLVVQDDPLDTATRHQFKLFYVASINRWAMIYSFKRATNTSPYHVYLRVGGIGYAPSEFGPAQKLRFPSGWELNGSGNGGVWLDYSVSQKKWLLAAMMLDRNPATDLYKNTIWVVDDSFYCPIE